MRSNSHTWRTIETATPGRRPHTAGDRGPLALVARARAPRALLQRTLAFRGLSHLSPARLKLAAALPAAVAGVGLVALGTSHPAGASAGGRPASSGLAGMAASGRAARVVSVKDEGHLHSVKRETSGSMLVEEGPVTGTIPGTVKVRFNIGPTVTASFTIYATRGGSINGHGSGTLHSTSKFATFGGSLKVTSGTGRYAHAHGSGGLYGSINRNTYALTVQTLGTLYY
ncbi:MAG TPA: hypothetical protein VNY52_11830 [Solirubrobacteraceae bacterium]|nr:hypothetical protein [Solirubrobacteraceae bacterium]